MKKIVLALVMASFSFGAIAAATGNVCTAAADSAATALTAGTSEFVKNTFTPKCSANTYVSYSQTATVFGVGSSSLKGKNKFGGSSEGGGVISKGACSATPCAQTDASTEAATAAGSSGSGTGTGT